MAQDHRYLRAARAESVDRTPVWIMRQAGRYLPEFREVRQQHDFFAICRTPSLAAAITLQPIDRFAGLLDASIIFSDILVIPQAMGLDVQMLPEKGPHFPAPLRLPADLDRVTMRPNVNQSLAYVFDALKETRRLLAGRVPLFGFCGAPWTLFAYMIEGGGSKTFSRASIPNDCLLLIDANVERWLWSYPEQSHQLLGAITDVCIEYLLGQVEFGGAEMLQVFDSWAGELAPHHFQTFALPYIRRIAEEVQLKLKEKNLPVVPLTIFAKGAHYALNDLLSTSYDVIGLDWTIDPMAARETAARYLMRPDCERCRVAFQGNLDPTILFGPPEYIRKETKRVLDGFLAPMSHEFKSVSKNIGYICNLGHGIQPETPPENVVLFLETVRDHSSALLAQTQE